MTCIPRSVLPFRAHLFLCLIFFLSASRLYAQQQLNLNFEKLSCEGISRPWGWDISLSSEGAEIYLDSLTKYKGRYSLKLKGAGESDLQVVTTDLEPYSLMKSEVNVGGWIRGHGLNGFAGFTIGYSVFLKDTVLRFSDTLKVKFPDTDKWKFYSLTASLPENVRNFSITLWQRGSAPVWFDDFYLSVNGIKKEAVQVGKIFSKEQLDWLHKNSGKINSVDVADPVLTAGDADLKIFHQITEKARIIAVGESTHGTSEFFRMKGRLLAYAVTVLGVRVFALEDNQLIAERANRYVLGGSGSARESMHGLFSVWQNQEMLDLIKWIRKYNDAHANDKVQFMGFDMQNPVAAFDSLYSFLKRTDMELYHRIDSVLAGARKNVQNSYAATDQVKLEWFRDSQKALELIRAKKEKWLSGSGNKKDSLAIEWVIQYAVLIKQYAENTYRGHMSLYRDVAMAENISWILGIHPPGTRVFVWAHDNHVSKGEDPVPENNYYGGISMGAHLTKKYGAAYKAFGQYTYSGEYFSQISYSDFRQISCSLAPGPEGSLDEALHKVAAQKKADVLFLDLSRAKQADWFRKPLPVRFANHVCMEYSYWTRIAIPFQFDGIFFMDRSGPARPAKDK